MGAGSMQEKFIRQSVTFEDFPTESPRVRRLLEQLRRAAESECAVFLVGEPGTGKTLLALALHNASRRHGRLFRSISLGEVRAELAASELFGHVRGAFTGATKDRPGLFRAAEGGTLFIDEVGAAPVEVQTALLAAIEYRQVRPIGSDEQVSVDVRLVLASSVPPERMRGDPSRWLPEFVDRVDSVVFEVPPLRERREDIPALATRIVREVCHRDGRRAPKVDSRCLDALRERVWRGNLRELRAVLESALLACEGHELLPGHLPPEKSRPAASNGILLLDEVDRHAVREAVARCGGNRRRAAKALGISRGRLTRALEGACGDAPGEDHASDAKEPVPGLGEVTIARGEHLQGESAPEGGLEIPGAW